MTRQPSLAGLMAAVYLLLLAYASLYPFLGWHWPAGAGLSELLPLSWPPWRDRFDEWANLLGYMPFGAFVFVALASRRDQVFRALIGAAMAAAAVSYAMEFLQHFIPGRFPSLRDWVNNLLGGAVGASLAWAARSLGWFDASHRFHERWFEPQGSTAQLLLVLWPMGLLFPAPVPLGLGQIGPELHEWLQPLLNDTPLADALAIAAPEPAGGRAVLSPAREAAILTLGLVAPSLLAAASMRGGWLRVFIGIAAALVAVVVMTLSTALNFGPDHAWAWMTRQVSQTLALAALCATLLSLTPPRVCAVLGVIVLTALVVAVAGAPADPYYAASLQGWEQGRFIRFHGLALWIGLLWPYAALAWLTSRLARRPR